MFRMNEINSENSKFLHCVQKREKQDQHLCLLNVQKQLQPFLLLPSLLYINRKKTTEFSGQASLRVAVASTTSHVSVRNRQSSSSLLSFCFTVSLVCLSLHFQRAQQNTGVQFLPDRPERLTPSLRGRLVLPLQHG